jgi:hypothetical protein
MRGWRGFNLKARSRSLELKASSGCCNCPSLPSLNKQETVMPYRRGGFTLTPPSVVIFLISIVLAILAMLVHYAHVPVPIISASRVFDVLAIAYVLLAAGVLIRGV